MLHMTTVTTEMTLVEHTLQDENCEEVFEKLEHTS